MGDILIVDDERDIRELISDILQDEGFETRIAGTAEDCMKEVDAAPPGLLILDLWLKDRDLDGIDILKKVKKNYPHVPVVIISGHGNIEIAVAAIKQGAYDFIEKPFNINQLLVVIRRAMEASQLRRENLELRSKEEPRSDMIGQSAGFKTLLSNLDKALSKFDKSVLNPALCPIISLRGSSLERNSKFSRRSWDASIARRITTKSWLILKGFSIKSYAPCLIAATAISILPCPEIITTGTWG